MLLLPWDAFEKAVLLCDPVGIATDLVQSDSAASPLLLRELHKIDKRYQDLEQKDVGMKTVSQTALRLFRKRVASNFNYKMLNIFEFLNPLIDQRTAYTDEQREELAADVMHFAKCMYERRGELENFSEGRCMAQLGRFMNRPASEKEFLGSELEVFEMYWSKKTVSWIDIAAFAIPLGEACITEAAVERGFSAEGRIFRKMRSRLSDRA